MAIWNLDDNTNGKNGGYLQITRNGQRVADCFPYARDADPELVRSRAKQIVNTMNASESDGGDVAVRDALAQAVAWIEECGSDHEGRQYVLTEARAALKGLSVARAG